MKVLLVQLDGKLPNIALMRIASHHRKRGHEIVFRHWARPEQCLPSFDTRPHRVYASAIFERTAPVAKVLLAQYPNAIIGGTGIDPTSSVERYGITTLDQDYSIYPDFQPSIGFTQRGCRLKCSFCVVPKKEGSVRQEHTIEEIWRGDPWPRELLLLDNDFFGQLNWHFRIREIIEGGFKVSFNQGINVRMIGEEEAEAIASVDYRDDQMKTKRIYTAWDNRKDEARLFRGLELLVKYGVKPDHILVYMLCGYWPDETHEDREVRRRKLREFGARPYPMPYVRTHELIGYQRWIVGAYDKAISWEDWQHARYEPRNLTPTQSSMQFGAELTQPKGSERC